MRHRRHIARDAQHAVGEALVQAPLDAADGMPRQRERLRIARGLGPALHPVQQRHRRHPVERAEGRGEVLRRRHAVPDVVRRDLGGQPQRGVGHVPVLLPRHAADGRRQRRATRDGPGQHAATVPQRGIVPTPAQAVVQRAQGVQRIGHLTGAHAGHAGRAALGHRRPCRCDEQSSTHAKRGAEALPGTGPPAAPHRASSTSKRVTRSTCRPVALSVTCTVSL
jgi:hypothetical protein